MSLLVNLCDNPVDRYLNLKTDLLVRLFKDMDDSIQLNPLIEYQLLYKQYEKILKLLKLLLLKE